MTPKDYLLLGFWLVVGAGLCYNFYKNKLNNS